jgi:predicted phosphoribosyltransferase
LASVALISKQNPAKIIVAIPVASRSALDKIKSTGKVDEVVCLEVPYNFQAVGQFYEEFEQVTDEEAIHILDTFSN